MAGDKKEPKNPLADPRQAAKFIWGPGDVKIIETPKKEGRGRASDGRPKEPRAEE